MRTTITLDDQLAKRIRRAAAARKLSVSAFIAKTMDDALTRREPTEVLPFKLVTVRGSRPRTGFDLDKPRTLDAQDDEARFAHRSR